MDRLSWLRRADGKIQKRSKQLLILRRVLAALQKRAARPQQRSFSCGRRNHRWGQWSFTHWNASVDWNCIEFMKNKPSFDSSREGLGVTLVRLVVLLEFWLVAGMGGRKWTAAIGVKGVEGGLGCSEALGLCWRTWTYKNLFEFAIFRRNLRCD